MMQIRTFMIKTHRLLGAVMSVFFVAWFLSGIVLIYKPYPKYTQDEALAHSARIPEALPSTDSLAAVLRARGLDTLQLSSLSLQGGSYADSRARLVLQPEEGERVELAFDGDSLRSLVLDRAYLEDIASRWGQRIERIDTIQELDQWVPFGRLKAELPFYRLLLTGGAGHEVYVSSLTGRVLQESTRVERAWAWAGAIPHWIYFTWIRSQQELWRWVIIVLGALGTMMAVTGFYIGISYYRMRGVGLGGGGAHDADADVVAGALLPGGAQLVGGRGRQPEVGVVADEAAGDVGGQVGLAQVDPRHRRAQVARRQEDVDAVVDDDGDPVAHRPGHVQHPGQEGAAVGVLGAQLDAGDPAVDGGRNGGQDVASARAALVLVGDEVDRQVRRGPHDGSPSAVRAASAAPPAALTVTVTARRSPASRAYRASRKAGWKEPGPADRACARFAAAL